MSNAYNVEYTDTYGGEANYCWVRRARVVMPELTHYGYDGYSNYSKANKIASREPWPLYININDDPIAVFDDAGALSSEFIKAITE